MKRLAIFILLGTHFIAASCSGGRAKKSGQDPTSPVVLSPSTTGTDSIKGGDSDSIQMELLPDRGSAMRLLDARALTVYYQNVFAQKAYGYMHCAQNKPLVMADCTDSIFTKEERVSMGAFDLGSPRMGRAPQNVNPPATLTLNYTRTLRAALNRECTSLVDQELSKLNAGDVSENFLIKAEKPTGTHLNDFMKRLLGVAGTDIVVPFNADTYVNAFNSVLDSGNDKVAATKNAFIGVCIALSMDPLVILY